MHCKSTIFKLLIRLHDAKSGEIKFGDTEIQDIQIKSLRSCVSVVSQNTFIFNDTLKNNINLEKNESSENIDFEKLMDDLNINNFADKLQNKYDTKLVMMEYLSQVVNCRGCHCAGDIQECTIVINR